MITTLEAQLQAAALHPETIAGALSNSVFPRDPWGRPWAYRIMAGRIEVYSAGENGLPGDDDDVANEGGHPRCPYTKQMPSSHGDWDVPANGNTITTTLRANIEILIGLLFSLFAVLFALSREFAGSSGARRRHQ
jgi:hypothetical protein